MNSIADPGLSHAVPTRLSASQLRRLEEYLEDKCLELTRGVHKRNELNATYGSLSAYVSASSSLVTMVLLIPPTKSSAGMRTSWLLRITGDIFENIPAYSLGSRLEPASDIVDDDLGEPRVILTEEGLSALESVFQLFDKLDEGWCAVIRNEHWDPALNHGVFSQISNPGDPTQVTDSSGSRAFSVTDSTRLRSLIVSGKEDLDDWLAEQGGGGNFEVAERSIRVMARTLTEMGQDVTVPVQAEPDFESSDEDI